MGASLKYKILIPFLLFFTSNQIMAAEPVLYQPDVVCPSTNPVVSDLLSKLTDLKKKFEKLDCKEITVKVDKINEIIDQRSEVLGIVFENENKILTPESAKKVQDYASTLTEEAGVLISRINSAAKGEDVFNRCQLSREQELESIERVTGAIYETVSILSKVAGPYGVPLQLGGEIMAGVVKGLKGYSERVKNIDFSAGEDGGYSKRQFYEQSVCLFAKIDSEINRVLNPKHHLRKLLNVKNKVTQNQEQIFSGCSDCLSILSSSSSTEARELFDQRDVLDVTVPYKDLERLALEEKVNTEWLDGEIKKFRALANYQSTGVGTEEVGRNRSILRRFLYRTATKDFMNFYIKEASSRKKDFSRLVVGMRKSIARDVKEIGEELEEDYLSEEYKEAVKESMFKRQEERGLKPHWNLMAFKREAHYHIVPFYDIYDLYLYNRKTSLLSELSDESLSWIADAFDMWREAVIGTSVVEDYCEFFKRIKQYRADVKNRCMSPDHISNKLKTAYQAFALVDLMQEHFDELSDYRGPFDFDLAKRKRWIEESKNQLDHVLPIFPEVSLNFDEMLAFESQESSMVPADDLLNELSLQSRSQLSFGDWDKSVDYYYESLMTSLGVGSSSTPGPVTPAEPF